MLLHVESSRAALMMVLFLGVFSLITLLRLNHWQAKGLFSVHNMLVFLCIVLVAVLLQIASRR